MSSHKKVSPRGKGLSPPEGSPLPFEVMSLLDEASGLIGKLGKDFAGDRDRLDELKERRVRERFHLAVLGQFKRGKSTLVEDLLMHNVENLRWATLQNIDRTFRRFVSELDAHLERTIQGVRKGMVHALQRKQEGEEKLTGEMDALRGQERRCGEIASFLRTSGE